MTESEAQDILLGPRPVTGGWPRMFALVDDNIANTELKLAQLKALRRVFERQQRDGDPTPFEIAEQTR